MMSYGSDIIVSIKDNIIKTKDIDAKFNPYGLGDQFYKLMLNNSTKIAQIDGITGRTQTYEQLLSRCVLAAKAMRKYGVKPGDIITPFTDNHMDACVPFIASLFIGAYTAPVDVGLSQGELESFLNKFQPKIIFCSPRAEEILETKDIIKSNTEIVVFGYTKRHTSFKEFLDSSIESSKFEVYKVKSLLDTAYISLTGGSTGNHKAACLHHLSMFNFVNNCSYASESNTTLMTFSPLLWISAPLNICRSISSGYARLIFPKFDPKNFFYIISKYQISNIVLSVFAIGELLKEKVPEGVDISCLKSLRYIGSPITKYCLNEVTKMLPDTIISSCYGQTEIGGHLFNFDWGLYPQYLKEKFGSAGRPIKGIEYKLVDVNTGEALGPYQHGHLLVRSNLQMNEYYKTDSSNVWDEERWLKTGDILYYDQEYFFYFVDRMKEMIRYRSWAVSPLYLENILMRHPCVELAFVTGVPHDQDGDHPVGAVVLKEGKSATGEEIEEFVNDQVEDTRKLRGGVKIVTRDFVPYSVTGKVQRYHFRRKILESMEYYYE